MHFKARYANGVLTPLEPLDLDEGKEVMLSIEDTETPVQDAPSIRQRPGAAIHRGIVRGDSRSSVPPDAWDDLPTDLAKNKKHYLYGHPKE